MFSWTPINLSSFSLPCPRHTATRSRAAMAATEAAGEGSKRDEPVDLRHYPTPLSPPHPELSRSIELRRAMSASSRSSLFSLSPSHVLFQDDSLAVLNKPPGVYCEALLPALASFLAGNGNAPELHLANRLDRDTSGLTVVTKSHQVAAALVRAFTDHAVTKSYVARCVGRIPAWRSLRIVSGHGRSRHGAWRVYAASDVDRKLPGGSVVRHMETAFEVLAVGGAAIAGASGDAEAVVVEAAADRGREAEGERVEVLLRAFPRSGRTHQIRLHCQYLGLPLKGDVKYGGVVSWEGEECEMHCLHSESLSFEHPATGNLVHFRAPIPPWASI